MKKERRSIPRFAPARAFPSYAFVPGMSPHPTHDPRGHSFNRIEEEIEAPDPKRWKNNEHYLYGIDLFNYGYYWEAHEIWEDLWNADGRIGLPSDFLKGLIKLAAAGVKAREGVRRGVRTHAQGAALLFEAVRSKQTGPDARYMGLSLGDLIHFARSLAQAGAPLLTHTDDAGRIVFDWILSPQDIPPS